MSEREIVTKNQEDAFEIVSDDSEEFDIVTTKITGTWRHGNELTTIVQRRSDEKFFRIDWRKSGDGESSFEDCNGSSLALTEVFPKQKTIIVYE